MVRSKLLIVAFSLIFLSFVTVGIYRYFRGTFEKSALPDEGAVFSDTSQEEEYRRLVPDPALKPLNDGTFKVVEVTRDLEVPWSIAFTSASRFLVSERAGRIRVVENGQLSPTPLHTFNDVSSKDEEGLMGLIAHPAYVSNHYIYACYAYPSGDGLADKVVRFTDTGSALTDEKTIIDGIPAAPFHAGCELAFGPDGMLYISTGDATNKDLAQDMSSLAGKILRLTTDGEIPADNPFTDSPVWSFGHRNPQGLVWWGNGTQSLLFEVEHGPSGFDGPGGGDEFNLVSAGKNYGWPLVSHDKTREGMVTPLLVFTPAVAPSSLTAYFGTLLPQFRDNLFFTLLKGEGIIRVVLDPANPEKLLFYERLPGIDYGRIRDIAVGPDGALYFTTSNRDGRGKPNEGDDKIFKIVPIDQN